MRVTRRGFLGLIGVGTVGGLGWYLLYGDGPPDNKLFPSDGDAPDQFGYSVDLSGDGTTGLIGARFDQNRAGSAYVFSGSNESFQQEAKLTAADTDNSTTQQGTLGRNVALSADGTTAVCGAPNNFSPGPGAAYIFTRQDRSWRRSQTFVPENVSRESEDPESNSARFGYTVAISADGSTVLGTALSDNTPRGTDAGAAYVFEKRGESWIQTAKLFPEDGERFDKFGAASALSADGLTALIGGIAGGMYTFTRTSDSWSQEKFVSEALSSHEDGNSSVALSGDGTTALITVPFHSASDGEDANSAYVFTRSGDSWTRAASLSGQGDSRFDVSWGAVDLSEDGTVALLSAYGDTGQTDEGLTATVQIFHESEGTWSHKATLTAPDQEEEDRFGRAVALSGDGTTALVGAPGDSDPLERGNEGGSAYVFDVTSRI